MTPIEIIENSLNEDELKQLAWDFQASYQSIMFDYEVWNLIERICSQNIMKKLMKFKKNVVGHQIVNDLIMKHYTGERVVKYHFIKEFLGNTNEVCAFEMNVNSSRLDISRINGKSYAYEIKTELDTLSKVTKQINDYSMVLEYIYVLAPEKHINKISEIIPKYCGIIRYDLNGNHFSYKTERKALKSPNLSKDKQIYNLTSKELHYILRSLEVSSIPTHRIEREYLVKDILNDKKMNDYYKYAIKYRFSERWDHLQDCFEMIQPIDVQTFFNTLSDPKWIYYKNSSMV